MIPWLSVYDLCCRDPLGQICIGPISKEFSRPFTIIEGNNGSGKTVLGRILTGLSPTILEGFKVSGKIEYHAKSTSPHDPRVFAFLPQAWALSFIGSRISTDIELASLRLRLTYADVLSQLEALGLCAKEVLFRHPYSLSRGERQRVMLAILAATRPIACYLDEPDAFLDVSGVTALIKIIQSLVSQDKKVIVATHQPENYRDIYAEPFTLPGKIIIDLKDKKREDAPSSKGIKKLQHKKKLQEINLDADKLADLSLIQMGPERNLRVDWLPVRSGEMTAIFGNNGTGKTSFLRRLFKVMQNGTLNGIAGQRNGHFVSLVSDEPDDQLLFRSVKDEIRLIGAIDLLSENSLIEEGISRIGGMDKDVSHLSWGERRLLTILMGMLQSPSVLLIDEVEAGLDKLNIELIHRLVDGFLSVGGAVVLTMNRMMSFWQKANNRAIISPGKGMNVLSKWATH